MPHLEWVMFLASGRWRQGAAKRPTVHGTASFLTDNCPSLNINCANVEKPWFCLKHLKAEFNIRISIPVKV